jgi:hypothetical protein
MPMSIAVVQVSCFISTASIGLILILGASWPVIAAQTGPTSNRFEPEIEQFEASDRTNPPPRNAVLFIGSSSIRFWRDLGHSFPGHQIIQRGFGGSELSDCVEFADRIVIPYQPKMIFLYAGDNDLANGKLPQKIFSDFATFAKKVHARLPKTVIAYIAIKPSLARQKLINEMKTANALINTFVKPSPTLIFIDVFTPMLRSDGTPRPELFVEDGLHLNEEGYALWIQVLKPVLDRFDGPESKTLHR